MSADGIAAGSNEAVNKAEGSALTGAKRALRGCSAKSESSKRSNREGASSTLPVSAEGSGCTSNEAVSNADGSRLTDCLKMVGENISKEGAGAATTGTFSGL